VTTGAIALRSVINTYRTARVPVVDLELSLGRDRSEHVAVTRSHLFWVEGSGCKQLQTEATYDGFAVAEPPKLHAEGRTYRTKNTREQYEPDAHDLALAAQKDARALEAAIKAGVVDDLDCVQAMWGVLQSIGGKTQEDYDHELGGLAQAQLESSGFNEIIRNTCVGHDLQT
jgi:hypothetical protein